MLQWKFDLRILPTLAVMYLFNGLDKGNMGNAKTAGLEEDLKLKGNQYNILLSVCPLTSTALVLSMAKHMLPFRSSSFRMSCLRPFSESLARSSAPLESYL